MAVFWVLSFPPSSCLPAKCLIFVVARDFFPSINLTFSIRHAFNWNRDENTVEYMGRCSEGPWVRVSTKVRLLSVFLQDTGRLERREPEGLGASS